LKLILIFRRILKLSVEPFLLKFLKLFLRNKHQSFWLNFKRAMKRMILFL